MVRVLFCLQVRHFQAKQELGNNRNQVSEKFRQGRNEVMKASNSLWKEQLAGKMPETLAREIDVFETEIILRKQGKLDERLFAETRLRRAAYRPRYNNAPRHAGPNCQQTSYPPR